MELAGVAGTLDSTTVFFPRGATRMTGRTGAVVALGELVEAI